MRIGRVSLATALLLVGSVTACSSDGAGGSVRSTSPAAPSSSASANPSVELFGKVRSAAKSVRTVQFEESLELRDQASDEPLSLAGIGTATFSDGKLVSIRMTVRADDARGEVIGVDRTIFLRMRGENSSTGKPWVRSESRAAEKYVGILIAYQLLLSPVSPEFLAAQQPGATNIRKRFETKQDGVEVTPFAMDIDPAKVSAAAALLKKVKGGAGQLSTTVQIDEQGRPVTLNTNGDNSGAYLRLGVSYTKYDSPVTITAPPASQVAG